jgi:outer membrane protein assembly factor BamB
MLDVFISYTKHDRERVRLLAEALIDGGLDVWWDHDLEPGDEFDDVIERQLESAACVVVAWSERSVKSKWVRSEADVGRERGVLVPVFLDQVSPPLSFRLIHAADLSDWAPGHPHPGFDQLMEKISRIVGRSRQRGATPTAPTRVDPQRQAGPTASRGRERTASATTTPGLPDGGFRIRKRSHPASTPGGAPSVASGDTTDGPLRFPRTIRERWRCRLPGDVHAPPQPDGAGGVAALTRSGALVAVDAGGALSWTAVLGGGRGVGGQALARARNDDLLAVTDGYLHRVAPDGAPVWRWTNLGSVTARPASDAAGNVYAMTNRSVLWAISSDGEEIWSRELCQVHGGGTWPGPAYDEGIVYAVCKGRDAYAIDAVDGSVLWSYPVNDRASSSPVSGPDGTCLFATDAGWVFCLGRDGGNRWVASTSGGAARIAQIDAPLAIGADGTLFVAPRHGTLFAIGGNGKMKWQAAMGGQGTGDRSPAPAPDGRVFVATTQRELIGFTPEGDELFRVQGNGWVSTPQVGGDGVLYVGIGSDLFALEVEPRRTTV